MQHKQKNAGILYKMYSTPTELCCQKEALHLERMPKKRIT